MTDDFTPGELLAIAATLDATADRTGLTHLHDLANRLTTAAASCTCNQGETHE